MQTVLELQTLRDNKMVGYYIEIIPLSSIVSQFFFSGLCYWNIFWIKTRFQRFGEWPLNNYFISVINMIMMSSLFCFLKISAAKDLESCS